MSRVFEIGGVTVTLPDAGEVWEGAGQFGVSGSMVTPLRTDCPEAEAKQGEHYGDPGDPMVGKLIAPDPPNPSANVGFWKAFATWVAGRVSPMLTLGLDLHAGHRPQNAQVKCTTVLVGPGQIEDDMQPLEQRYQVQLVTRAAEYGEAETEARRIADAVIGSIGYSLDGGWVLHSVVGSRPRWSGNDAKGAFEFTADLTVRTRQKET